MLLSSSPFWGAATAARREFCALSVELVRAPMHSGPRRRGEAALFDKTKEGSGCSEKWQGSTVRLCVSEESVRGKKPNINTYIV